MKHKKNRRNDTGAEVLCKCLWFENFVIYKVNRQSYSLFCLYTVYSVFCFPLIFNFFIICNKCNQYFIRFSYVYCYHVS